MIQLDHDIGISTLLDSHFEISKFLHEL